MKFDIEITNLGKIKSGNFKIRPITVLTGVNGAGKSFFTKSLYSILNVINKNNYIVSIREDIRFVRLISDMFLSSLRSPAQYDKDAINDFNLRLNTLQDKLIFASSNMDINNYLDFVKSCSSELDITKQTFESYIKRLRTSAPNKYALIENRGDNLVKHVEALKSKLANSRQNYSLALEKNLSNEIKENFQISDLSQLTTFGEEQTSFSSTSLLDIRIEKSRVDFTIGSDFINETASLSTVVFFESPSYWKVREALLRAKDNAGASFFRKKEANELLTGVPKYFYDLNETLKKQLKKIDSSYIEHLTQNIKEALDGEFEFNGDSLVFKDATTGKEVSKNLISFGMTNLGMIHALLKSGVITEGSFVFIDEPETNLHPSWQVLLMNTLIALARHNINVVIATHSIDMLKALEVGLLKGAKNNEVIGDDFISMHYLEDDGLLYKFENTDNPLEQVKEARNMLSHSYEELFYEGSKL